jgi:hypothetical protein
MEPRSRHILLGSILILFPYISLGLQFRFFLPQLRAHFTYISCVPHPSHHLSIKFIPDQTLFYNSIYILSIYPIIIISETLV